MNRNDFIEQLTWLLQDIPEEEREGAIEYYQDYFDEAGIGAEDETGEKLGSPEKVAAMVRDGLTGGNADAGEYTETGYQDKRFKEKENMPEKRDAFQKEENGSSAGKGEEGKEAGYYDYSNDSSYNYSQYGSKQDCYGNYQNGYSTNAGRDNGNAGKIILIVLLCIFAVPVIIPVAGAAFGIIAGIFGIVFGLVVTAGALTLAGGVLMIWLTVTIAGRFIPWFIRVIVNIFSMLFHRRGGQAA